MLVTFVERATDGYDILESRDFSLTEPQTSLDFYCKRIHSYVAGHHERGKMATHFMVEDRRSDQQLRLTRAGDGVVSFPFRFISHDEMIDPETPTLYALVEKDTPCVEVRTFFEEPVVR